MLKGKTVVLGICGGIAAYKACEIVSRLNKLGANVRVMMTKSACEFVTPLTLQTLSKNPVVASMFNTHEKWEIEHISLAASADLMLIAPATANIIGKVASGIADDIVSTTIMATKAKVIFAPAMNSNMYENPITQANIKKLSDLGYGFIEPDCGMLACGTSGKGRLAEIDKIISAVTDELCRNYDLSGKTVVVTAGPTREKIDDVRFITNHSSGKMGYAIAERAKARGADVILISGPVNLEKPKGVRVIDIISAEDMFNAVMEVRKSADIIIKSAAVGDFKVKNAKDGKAKKETFNAIELEENKDILAELGKDKTYKLVGFCMETASLAENAVKKLKKKNADFIVANDLTKEGAGFGTDTNIVKIFYADGHDEELPIMSKNKLADEILDRVIQL